MEENKKKIVGVRFSPVGKVYDFDASAFPSIQKNDMVVVETSRGMQIGSVAQVADSTSVPGGSPLKTITRPASARDLMQRQVWQAREPEALDLCRARSTELGLHGIKIVQAEYSFDGSRLTYIFCSDSEDKVDLKSLRSDMQKKLSPTQVEFRQVGPRDVAKIYGGMGSCGMETRCCSRFLMEFNSISIRMAKEQNISLAPSEITGMCGRLRCCLVYEYENYCSCRSQLPKRNKRVLTPQGEGKVVELLPLKLCVVVEIPELGQREYELELIKVID